MTYSLIEQNIKKRFRSCNARKTPFSCENDWHDDSMHGSLPNYSLQRFIPMPTKNYRFLFWQYFICFASLLVSLAVLIPWPHLYECTPNMYSKIVLRDKIYCCIIFWYRFAHKNNFGFELVYICASQNFNSILMWHRSIAWGLLHIACIFLYENLQNVLIPIWFLGNNQN